MSAPPAQEPPSASEAPRPVEVSITFSGANVSLSGFNMLGGLAGMPAGTGLPSLPPGLAQQIAALARSGGGLPGPPGAPGASSAPSPPPGLAAVLGAAGLAGLGNGGPARLLSEALASHPPAAGGAAARPAMTGEAMQERLQRLGGVVAGTIFSDLISGALRPGDAGAPPASEKAIEALVRKVPCAEDARCSVCLDYFADSGGCATQMPCGHLYHDACVSQWLRSHNTCPVCRAAVEADETPRPSALGALLSGWRESRLREAAERSAAGDPPLSAAHAAIESLLHSGPAGLPGVASSLGAAAGSGLGASGAAGSLGGAAGASLASSLGSMFGPPPTPLPEAELLGFSVAELKRRLTAANVDFAGVVEKHELQELLRRSSNGPSLHLHMEVVQVPTPLNADGTPQALTPGNVQSAAAQAIAAAMAARIGGAPPAEQSSPAAASAATPAAAAQAATPAAALAAASGPGGTRRRRAHEPTPGFEPRETRSRSKRARRGD